MKKTYVLDTNVLLSDPNSIFSFQDNDVIIPMVVLEELDRHKTRQDDEGRCARQTSRALDALRAEGSLLSGVGLRGGGILRIVSIDPSAFEKLPFDLQRDKVDNMLIALMLQLQVAAQDPIVLVSKDINVRIKCDGLGVKCEDYLKMRVSDDPQKFYRGVETIEVDRELVDAFYATGTLALTQEVLKGHKLYPNQIVVIKNVDQGQTVRSALAKYVSPIEPLRPIIDVKQAFGLSPRNKEQRFAFDLLFDDSIKMLTLSGPSGCGKTLLVLAAALEQLKGVGGTDAKFEKLIVTRPIQPIGRDIGFLPGTLEEKMDPWIAPIKDGLNFLMCSGKNSLKHRFGDNKQVVNSNYYLQMLQERGLIEIEAITFIRGRSIPNAFIVVDEAQNISPHELKTILTRVGDGSKIVLTGDVEQIDSTNVDIYTNGLTHAIERFKEYSISGHVTMLKGERSELATLASKIL